MTDRPSLVALLEELHRRIDLAEATGGLVTLTPIDAGALTADVTNRQCFALLARLKLAESQT